MINQPFTKYLVLDLETICGDPDCDKGPDCRDRWKHALDPRKATVTAIGALDEDDNYYLFSNVPDFKTWYLKQPNKKLVGANLKFDLSVLHFKGLSIPDSDWLGDVVLMAQVLTEKIPAFWLLDYNAKRKEHGSHHREGTQHGLKTLAPWFLKVEPYWETADHSDLNYLKKDLLYTRELFKLFMIKFADLPHEYDFYINRHLPFAKGLLKQELHGIKFNRAELDRRAAKLTIEVEGCKQAILNEWAAITKAYQKKQEAELEAKYAAMLQRALEKNPGTNPERYKKLHAEAALKLEPFSVDSPSQLAWALRDFLGLDITTTEGKESTNVEVLNRLASQSSAVSSLLKYRELSKIATTYYPSFYAYLTKDDRIHPNFNLGMRTGRTSSDRPNLQNQPKETRDLFIADEGHNLVIKDMSQLEPTLIAHFTGDRALIDLITHNISFHCFNTKQIFKLPEPLDRIKQKYPELRDLAKEVGLAVLYGAGKVRVGIFAKQYNIPLTELEASNIVNRIRSIYSGIWSFKTELDDCLMAGEVVYGYMGRPICYDDPSQVYITGFNRLIQGSGSDIVQQSSVDIQKEYTVLGGVHDELIVQIPENDVDAERKIDYHMTKHPLDYGLKFKVEGGVSKTWKK